MAAKNNNKKLSREQLERALAELDPEDRQRVLAMAARAEEDLKDRFTKTKITFGRLSALELIAKVGMFYINKNIY